MDDDWPYLYKAKITRVIDGDTVEASVDLGFSVCINQKLRLKGINAPEMRDKPAGPNAREYLAGMVEGREINVRTHRDRTGKYGRYIATLYCPNNLNINKKMVENGHAEYREY